MSGSPEHFPHGLEAVLAERMQQYPAVIVQGPRSVGKTTLLHNVAYHAKVPVFDLDNPSTRALVAEDPNLFASGPRPVLIDEYQKVPVILDAIKAELNQNSGPGQFALSGSASFDTLPRLAQSLTGRLHLLTLYPLAQSELERSSANIVTTLFSSPDSLRSPLPTSTTREEYAQRIVRGGFPIALSISSAPTRNRWFDDYVRLTVERDAVEIRAMPRTDRLTRLLYRLAAQTAQVLNVATAAEQIDLEAKTAGEYVRLLEALFLVTRLPAWGTTLSSRVAKSPKLHIVDSGIGARLLQLSEDRLLARDASAITEFGHLLETFVFGEVQRHASWLEDTYTLGHWRTHDNAEVDIIVERDDGAVVAVEVKATSRITDASFRSLRKLRTLLPDRFSAGLILHLGQHSMRTVDGFYAAPVDVLWR